MPQAGERDEEKDALCGRPVRIEARSGATHAAADWIRDETHWGGEPEVSMLSDIFDVEITVAACDAMQVLRYGGGQGRKVVYLLYTGQHYDPLIGPPPEHRRLFPP